MTKVLLDLALPISGMTCASCVSHVEGALKDLQGVTNVVVNLATNKANLSYDPQLVKVDDLRRAVDDVGYAGETGNPLKPAALRNYALPLFQPPMISFLEGGPGNEN